MCTATNGTATDTRTKMCRATEKLGQDGPIDVVRHVQHEQDTTSKRQEGETWITRDAVSSAMRSQGRRVRAPQVHNARYGFLEKSGIGGEGVDGDAVDQERVRGRGRVERFACVVLWSDLLLGGFRQPVIVWGAVSCSIARFH